MIATVPHDGPRLFHPDIKAAPGVALPPAPKALKAVNSFYAAGMAEGSFLRYRSGHALGPTPPKKWTANRLLMYAIKKKLPDCILERCAAGTMTRREIMPCSGRKVRNK